MIWIRSLGKPERNQYQELREQMIQGLVRSRIGFGSLAIALGTEERQAGLPFIWHKNIATDRCLDRCRLRSGLMCRTGRHYHR